MKEWLIHNKLVASITAVFIMFGALFTALDKGFDFWEEHVRAQPSKAPEGIKVNRVDISNQMVRNDISTEKARRNK